MKFALKFVALLCTLLAAGCAVMPKPGPDEAPAIATESAPVEPAAPVPEEPVIAPKQRLPAPPPGGAMAVAPANESAERAARLQKLGREPAAIAKRDEGYYLDVLYAALLKTLGPDAAPLRNAASLRILLPSSVTFAHGSDQLAAGADSALDPILASLLDYSALLISVHGHSDNTGPAEINRQLSARRALTVARRLQAAGVSSARLMVIGHGADQPIADNATDAGRTRNRRVEILLQPIIALPAGG